MDPGVGIILFGGAVLAVVLVLISHTNGQAKIDREKKERAKREAEFEAFERECEYEEKKAERQRERQLRNRIAEQEYEDQRLLALIAAKEKAAARHARKKHQETRNVLRQATEKRKARRLYPAGLVK